MSKRNGIFHQHSDFLTFRLTSSFLFLVEIGQRRGEIGVVQGEVKSSTSLMLSVRQGGLNSELSILTSQNLLLILL